MLRKNVYVCIIQLVNLINIITFIFIVCQYYHIVCINLKHVINKTGAFLTWFYMSFCRFDIIYCVKALSHWYSAVPRGLLHSPVATTAPANKTVVRSNQTGVSPFPFDCQMAYLQSQVAPEATPYVNAWLGCLLAESMVILGRQHKYWQNVFDKNK